ncbi:MAG: ABC-F family ATP-binding cassette domain-containing protein [Devosia sp.]
MPASISFHDLSYRTPDGRALFDHLNIAFGPGRSGLVGRNGSGKTTLLRLIKRELTPAGGTIEVVGRVGLLRQSVQPDCDASIAAFMGIDAEIARLDRLGRGAGSLEDAEAADWTLPSRLAAALDELGLSGLDPGRPIGTLSGGQRTRLALAALILSAPDMILLDEPTNNLDGDGRAAVAGLLAKWRGGAIVVSHDRALLREMDAIVELTSLGAASYGGNWDFYRERKALELAAAEHRVAAAEQRLAEVDRRLQAQAERQAHRDAAGRKRGKQGGVPRIILGGMKRRAEATAGANARLAHRMREEAGAEAAEARAEIEVLQPLAVTLAPTGLPGNRRVLEASGLTGGPDPDAPIIVGFDLTIIGPERVAITGPNGIGKTTLLRLLTGELAPVAGSVRRFGRQALLDQTLSLLDPGDTIRGNYRRLNPADDENACRAALARFKFRAEAALQLAGTLSGGEMLRAGLAATIGATAPPELLILDEPTNHLDLEAIEAVEAGLRAYDGALIVVSHDRAFLEAIGIERGVVLGEAGPENSQARRKVK